MKRIESVETGKDNHTFALEKETNTIYAFLPQTHSAAVFVDN